MRIQLRGPNHAAGLLAELNRCRQTRQYCDVFLQVGSRTFAAHRAVLACAGTYFHTLFTRTLATASAVFSLEFISPVHFEKVLTFIYTGELFIDLIDVGVLYELAEKLGVSELMRACHTTFPDLQASVCAKASSSGDLPLDSVMVSASSAVTAISVASVGSSSAASCSSLSSSAGLSSAPTPAASSSPLFQGRSAIPDHDAQMSLNLKTEDAQSNISYGQMAADDQLQGASLLTHSSRVSQTEGVLPSGPALQLKIEQGLEDEEESRDCDKCETHGDVTSEGTGGSLPWSSDPTPSDSCSLPDSSAQLRVEACTPTSSSGEPPGSLQVVSVEGGVTNREGDGTRMFGEVETGRPQDETETLNGNGTTDETEEEQWRQMAGEIIELSDDEAYMENEEDEDDEDDLVCVEYGDTREGENMSQVTRSILSCKACSAPLPADPAAVRKHGESHLTELGLCRVCGVSFPDRAAGASHILSHVGVQLFTCDMCQSQFCSQSKLLRHHHQAASSYSVPQGALLNGSRGRGTELKCSTCTKTLTTDFQTVRDHLLSHTCPQTLTCGLCHMPQLSLCALLWHSFTHLSLPVFTCPHCTCCFVERPLLDRHLTAHAEEPAAMERQQFDPEADGAGEGPLTGVEERRGILCPQTFHSSSACRHHLSPLTSESLGTGGGVGGQGWLGKRKAGQTLECPSSSCSSSTSPQDTGKVSKFNHRGLGLGMSFSVSEKFLQGPGPQLSSGTLINGSTGLEGAASSLGVRGKWYRCRYCGKRFAHSGEFTYHLRIHTGEKPYQCKVCLRFFRGRSTMICHLKTHSGALMYRCTMCGFYFSTLKLVSSHMELHKDHLPPDFNIEQTFMYNDHSKEPLPPLDA